MYNIFLTRKWQYFCVPVLLFNHFSINKGKFLCTFKAHWKCSFISHWRFTYQLNGVLYYMTILCNIVFCFYGFLLFGRNALTRKCASLYFLTLYAHLQSKTRKWKISSSSPENEKLFFFYFLSNYWVVCICADCILPSYNNFS